MIQVLPKFLNLSFKGLYIAFTVCLVLVSFSGISKAQTKCAISLDYYNSIEMKLKNSPIITEPKDIKSLIPDSENQTTVKIVTLEGGLRAIWKPEDGHWASNPISEVVSYKEVDRRYGFNFIPPTVIREINGQRGSLQLFAEAQFGPPSLTVKLRHSDPSLDPIAPDRIFLELLDYLLDNTDRNSGNYLVSHLGSTIAIDHGATLGNIKKINHVKEINEDIIIKLSTIKRGKKILEEIMGTNLKEVKKELTPQIGSEETASFIKRIKKVQELSEYYL